MQKVTLKLKPGSRARVLKGHPWVFAGEVERLLPDSMNGQGVALIDARGHLLGSGIYNRQSKIIWRRYSRKDQPFDRSFLQLALEASLQRRDLFDYGRLAWSEADHLPGLVVDKMGNAVVVQAMTCAMDQQLPTIIEVLQKKLNPVTIVLRNDAPTRQYEGLPLEIQTIGDPESVRGWHTIDNVDYYLDLSSSHKTGFYLDQREQHRRIAQLAPGRKVLDAFCNQGSFALHCARAGASSVLAIDVSEKCCQQVSQNAEQNQLAVEVQCANMFDWFTEHKNERFDLIILDPPSFARNKGAVEGALRGYKELNLRALNMLNTGGILATYACSQTISESLFFELLIAAAQDARVEARLIEKTGQPADHPVLLNVPETHYLKGAILAVQGNW